jgi:mono/diheme cytochrome c family protein
VGGIFKFSVVAIVALLVIAGSARADSASDEAATLLSDRCAVCHGDEGKGDGPGAANLDPKPKDFHNAKWQKSVSDPTLTKAIIEGGAAVGLSKAMPGNPDLANRPAVVAALVKQIRAWGKKP